MTISCACSLETRRQYLANLFVDLLADQSRWVRMSAFQQLGPFISTFADPRLTGIYVAEDGSIVLQEGWSVAFKFVFMNTTNELNRRAIVNTVVTCHHFLSQLLGGGGEDTMSVQLYPEPRSKH